MTRYLVDTNVISAGAPTAAVRRPDLIAWMDSHSPQLFLSAVTIAEIADGIAKGSLLRGRIFGRKTGSHFSGKCSKREGARRKASDLSAWLRTVLHLYGDRVLPFDSPTAEIASGLADLARGRGHAPGFADIAIAATARRHDLTILSRNARHFAPMDAAVVDPFHELPPAK